MLVYVTLIAMLLTFASSIYVMLMDGNTNIVWLAVGSFLLCIVSLAACVAIDLSGWAASSWLLY